jgi:hypothetical protein
MAKYRLRRRTTHRVPDHLPQRKSKRLLGLPAENAGLVVAQPHDASKRLKTASIDGSVPPFRLYRVMHASWKHHDFQWRRGLNVLQGPFNASRAVGGPGGLYACSAVTVLKMLRNAAWSLKEDPQQSQLVEVSIPLSAKWVYSGSSLCGTIRANEVFVHSLSRQEVLLHLLQDLAQQLPEVLNDHPAAVPMDDEGHLPIMLNTLMQDVLPCIFNERNMDMRSNLLSAFKTLGLTRFAAAERLAAVIPIGAECIRWLASAGVPMPAAEDMQRVFRFLADPKYAPEATIQLTPGGRSLKKSAVKRAVWKLEPSLRDAIELLLPQFLPRPQFPAILDLRGMHVRWRPNTILAAAVTTGADLPLLCKAMGHGSADPDSRMSAAALSLLILDAGPLEPGARAQWVAWLKEIYGFRPWRHDVERALAIVSVLVTTGRCDADWYEDLVLAIGLPDAARKRVQGMAIPMLHMSQKTLSPWMHQGALVCTASAEVLLEEAALHMALNMTLTKEDWQKLPPLERDTLRLKLWLCGAVPSRGNTMRLLEFVQAYWPRLVEALEQATTTKAA